MTQNDFEIAGLPGMRHLPQVICPATPLGLRDTDPALRALTLDVVGRHGAALLRGFDVDGTASFRSFAASFGHALLSYDHGSTPRTKVGDGIYTSTEYPPHQSIPLHNEQAYTRQWPLKIWFYCDQPSSTGGATPIADSRAVYRKLPKDLVERFARKRLMYVRNYGNGLDLPWQRAFNTEDRGAVERYCWERGIACVWNADGGLTTRDICQAVARHPRSGEMVWFNQAHLFHVSALDQVIREELLTVVDEIELPRNVYYGDGSRIEESALDEVRGVFAEESVSFAWQRGDVLMLDNMLVAHGRAPFTGARRIVVAMAEPCEQVNGHA